ncbi:hypothetical protein FRB95_007775 [Tulasnella sp. JGI-2019a]|nr:hypothetical protein FRB95_007775 [Tulasnella sp. JGI-2019a]
MATSPSDTQRLTLSAVTDAAGKDILITITPPAVPNGTVDGDVKLRRAPVDFVLTIDISISMGWPANIPGDTEQSGLSVLDIVKHAAKTIVTSMQDTDRVAVVTFCESAKVALGLTQTDVSGKATAIGVIERLRTAPATNIWEGLKTSLDVFKNLAPSAEHSNRLSSIFLLTDGLPTTSPPGGHIPALKSYLKSNKATDHVTINTFGFGYGLDSRLLHSVAVIGRGTFGFIADAGMVGTVFVHAVANAYATYASNVEINIQVGDGRADVAKVLEVTGGYECAQTTAGLKVFMNPLQYGQSRDLFLKTSDLPSSEILVITARFKPRDSPEIVSDTQHVTLGNCPLQNPPQAVNVTYHKYRSKFVSSVYDMLDIATRTEDPPGANYGYSSQKDPIPTNAKVTFEGIVSEMEAALPADKTSAPDAHALLEDIRGQVILAVSEEATFQRWGHHYLLSMARAHQRQTCLNFKDVSLQAYGKGSTLFMACRDEIDTLFDNLPPPRPTVPGQPQTRAMPSASASRSPAPQQQGQQMDQRQQWHMQRAMQSMQQPSLPARQQREQQPSAPQLQQQKQTLRAAKAGFSMSSYNSRANPCFAGSCLILLADGTSSLRVSDLYAGVRIKTPRGSRKVEKVVKTSIEGGKAEMCEIEKGDSKLVITPWHPIQHDDGRWIFPVDAHDVRMVDCDAVYSILLEADSDPDAHGAYIGGTLCVTLGHGIKRSEHDRRAHPFLGSYSDVHKALMNATGSAERGVVHAVGVERSEKTGLINGFEWK